MNEKLYAIFIDEGDGERLVWQSMHRHDAIRSESGRRFFYGGSSIMPLVFSHPNSAHAFIRGNALLEDFEEGAQYYVRKVMIIPYALPVKERGIL